jgi:signal transduction histidine kinase
LLLSALLSAATAYFFSRYRLWRAKQYNSPNEYALRHEYVRELLNAQIEIQNEMFRTFSFEIHDNVGQQLSLSKIHLSSIKGSLDDSTSQKVDDACALISQSLSDLRDLCRHSTVEIIRSTSLVSALQMQLKSIENTRRIHTELDVSEGLPELDENASLILYSMLQETINNITSHAQATRILVRLHANERRWIADVIDNGLGFKYNAKSIGEGLKKLHNRARLIGADIRINSQPVIGTRVCVSIPYKKTG